jgi:hypothetical protein
LVKRGTAEAIGTSYHGGNTKRRIYKNRWPQAEIRYGSHPMLTVTINIIVTTTTLAGDEARKTILRVSHSQTATIAIRAPAHRNLFRFSETPASSGKSRPSCAVLNRAVGGGGSLANPRAGARELSKRIPVHKDREILSRRNIRPSTKDSRGGHCQKNTEEDDFKR